MNIDTSRMYSFKNEMESYKQSSGTCVGSLFRWYNIIANISGGNSIHTHIYRNAIRGKCARQNVSVLICYCYNLYTIRTICTSYITYMSIALPCISSIDRASQSHRHSIAPTLRNRLDFDSHSSLATSHCFLTCRISHQLSYLKF